MYQQSTKKESMARVRLYNIVKVLMTLLKF